MKKVKFCLAALIFLLAPFHAFFITWFRTLEPSGFLDFAVSAWREIILLILFFFAAPKIISTLLNSGALRAFFKKYGFLVLFILFPLVFLPFQFSNVTQWLWGIRFDIPLFLSFLIFLFLDFSEDEKKILFKIFLGTGFTVVLFGILHALFLPKDILVQFGYSLERDIWDVSNAAASCQPLEHTQKFCRAIATFGGPTRFGTYLLLLLGVSTFTLLKAKKSSSKYFLGILAVLAILNLLFTFSRSIWIGFFFGIVAILFLIAKTRTAPIPWVKIIVSLSAIILVFLFFTFDSLKIIFLRASSTSEHFELFKTGAQAFFAHPFGMGLGTAGPASLRFERFITENWYLQIALEMGFLGLAIFLAGLYQMLRSAFLSSPGIAFALIGIAVAGLFTHSFEETTTVILLGGMLGLSRKSDKFLGDNRSGAADEPAG